MMPVVSSVLAPKSRYVGILQGALTAFMSRGLAVAINLLSVSLALPYLGAEAFGAYAALVTAQLWLQLADFGLPAGVTTPVASALARGQHQHARQLIGTSMCAAFVGSAVVFTAACFAAAATDVSKLLHFRSATIGDQFNVAFLWTVGLSVLATPNAIITRVLLLQQRSYLANSFQLAGQLAALAAMFFCTQRQADIVTLTVVTIGFPALANLICTLWFFKSQPRFRFSLGCLRLSSLRGIGRISAAYSALQFAGMLLLNSSIFLAAAAISADAAAEFSVTTRLTTLCTVASQLVAPYFWAAYTDAIVKSDHAWLRRAFRSHVLASVGVAVATAATLLLVAPTVITRWTSGHMVVNHALLGWSLAWQILVAAMNPVGALLNAFDRYTLQTITSLLAGAAALWLGSALSERYGVAAVPAATTLSYLIFTAGPVSLKVKRLL